MNLFTYRRYILQKCTSFNDIFPGLSRTEVIFRDFPVLEFSGKKIQDFPGGVGTLVVSSDNF